MPRHKLVQTTQFSVIGIKGPQFFWLVEEYITNAYIFNFRNWME